MITPDQRWSLPRGNTPVPSRWQATLKPTADTVTPALGVITLLFAGLGRSGIDLTHRGPRKES